MAWTGDLDAGAAGRLAEALGQKSLVTTQLGADIAARAKSLDDALAAHLPKTVDDLINRIVPDLVLFNFAQITGSVVPGNRKHPNAAAFTANAFQVC